MLCSRTWGEEQGKTADQLAHKYGRLREWARVLHCTLCEHCADRSPGHKSLPCWTLSAATRETNVLENTVLQQIVNATTESPIIPQ